MHWKEIQTIGTETNKVGEVYNFYNIDFLNSEIGLFSGKHFDITTDNNSIDLDKNQNAIILRTIDSGHSWNETVLGKGEILDFDSTENSLFTLRRSYHGESAEEYQSHIHTSKDKGKTWEEVYSTEETFDEIHFWTPNKGIAILGLRGYVYNSIKILKTDNAGKTWEEINIPQTHETMSFEITKNGVLYYLTKEGKSFISVDLNSQQNSETSLNFTELPFSIFLDNQDNLYFVSENEDKRNILYKKERNSDDYTQIEFPVKDTMINDVWIFENVISIIVDKDGGSYYRSEDFGKTWKEEKFSKTFMRNIAFYGKDNIWIRTIPGKMLIRN